MGTVRSAVRGHGRDPGRPLRLLPRWNRLPVAKNHVTALCRGYNKALVWVLLSKVFDLYDPIVRRFLKQTLKYTETKH